MSNFVTEQVNLNSETQHAEKIILLSIPIKQQKSQLETKYQSKP